MNKEEFLQYMIKKHQGDNPLHRNLMSTSEIYLAEQLVKRGSLQKGVAIEDARMRIYYVNRS